MTTTIASCHCGGTRIELPEAPVHATQCTCTYCTKSGGIWAYYDVGGPRILSDTHGAIYSPTTPLHEHHFCARCGCTTYGT
ncbi:MAG TPA: GFA family protein, partial [Devosia sp.]